MFSVEPSSLGEEDVELRTVGVWSMVCHGYPSWTSVRQGEVFIVETFTIDTLAYKLKIVVKAWSRAMN